jgi:hypothetical protein
MENLTTPYGEILHPDDLDLGGYAQMRINGKTCFFMVKTTKSRVYLKKVTFKEINDLIL